MQFEISADVAAPAETVWAVLAEVEAWPTLSESMTSVEWFTGHRVETGNSARIVQPGLRPALWTVTSVEPGASFTWQASAGGVTTVGTHAVAPTAAGRARLVLGIAQRGALAGPVGLLLGRRTRRYVAMEADGLTRRAEHLASRG